MANECKKFALFACCLMTMQALRLVISTAGFCVVRFHIDCELFNIFISRLVNAVMMSSLFGNWLGDLIVFASPGRLKLYSIALANWAELICFFSGLASICAGEQGHLTGFYWSMVGAYFWWKVGEAPATSIGGSVVDWYFAGFTLSGVWAAMLKGVVMMFIFEEKGIHSEALGLVNVTVVGNVSVVGARSVKTTVDYRASKWLFATTIMVTFLMCVQWDVISESVDNEGSDSVLELLQKAAHSALGTASDNKLVTAIKTLGNDKTVNTEGGAPKTATLNFGSAQVEEVKAAGAEKNKIEITLGNVTKVSGNGQGKIQSGPGQAQTKAVQEELKKKLEAFVGKGKIESVKLSGNVPSGTGTVTDFKITVTVDIGRARVIEELQKAAISGALSKKLKEATNVQTAQRTKVDWGEASVTAEGVTRDDTDVGKIKIAVTVTAAGNGLVNDGSRELKTALEQVVGQGKIASVDGTGDGNTLTLTVTLEDNVKNTGREWLVDEFRTLASTKEATNADNRLANAMKAVGVVSKTVNFKGAEVEPSSGVRKGKTDNTVEITVTSVTNASQADEAAIKDHAKTQLSRLIGAARIAKVTLSGDVKTQPFALKVKVTVAAGIDWVLSEFHRAASSGAYPGAPFSASSNNLLDAIKVGAGGQEVNVQTSTPATLNLSGAKVAIDGSGVKKDDSKNELTITVNSVKQSGATTGSIQSGQPKTKATEGMVKKALESLVGGAQMDDVSVKTEAAAVTITVASGATGRVDTSKRITVTVVTGLVVGAVFVAPGALLLASLAKLFKKTAAASTLRVWAITGMVFGGAAATGGFVGATKTKTLTEMTELWVDKGKWETPEQTPITWAAMIGLIGGITLGALVGLIIGCCKASKLSGMGGGALVGAFVGLWTGEIYNGNMTWQPTNFLGKTNKVAVVVCGMVIVVGGLGTVYSIYPGMAPCSITQFQYFNIIDIWILILSVIAPIVIMVLDLKEDPKRLAWTILNAEGDGDFTSENGQWMWAAVVCGLVMLVATLICEAIVINVLQHPESNLAQKVTTSPWRACTLTILMVSFQLTSTGIGFGCAAAGSGLNVGVMNANSTVVLWSIECTSVLGEGYLTELKKYEPGKWPTQGMGKWATYKWWNRKTFGNAWQIWCCIGTTDLRRDIMLCRQ